MIKSHYIKLNDNVVVKLMQEEGLKHWLIYDKLVYIMGKDGYSTKIREQKWDYFLLSKKDDIMLGSKIAPRLEPEYLPLFEVGRITEETINKIRSDEKNR